MSYTSVSEASGNDSVQPASLRSPAISQGEVTIHCLVSLAELRNRKRREQNIRDIPTSAGISPTKVIPGAENDNNLGILQDELVFAFRGMSGLSNGTKLSGWTSLNGLTYKTLEELASQIMFLGTAKAAYNALSTGTPQNGIAIRFKGIFNMTYMANENKMPIIYPGQFLMYTLPSYKKRSAPYVNSRPSDKLVPTIEPFSFSAMAQLTQNLTAQAYSNKLAALPITVGSAKTAFYEGPMRTDSLTPFQRLAQADKGAEVVNLLHMLEPLIIRGHISVNMDSALFKSRKTPYSKILKGKKDDALATARKMIAHMAALLGVIEDDLEPSAADPDDINLDEGLDSGASGAPINEVQKDVYMTSKYPRIPVHLVDQYSPNLNYGQIKPVQKGMAASRKLDKAQRDYETLCKSSRECRDVTKAEFEQSIKQRVFGLNLTVCNPASANPRSEVYIVHGPTA